MGKNAFITEQPDLKYNVDIAECLAYPQKRCGTKHIYLHNIYFNLIPVKSLNINICITVI